MVQRLQALCLAHSLHTVPSVHRFKRAPPALSQVTLCQPRSLRLHAALLCRILGALHLCKCSPAAPATHPHPTYGCRHADYSTHRCLSGRLNATLSLEEFSLRCVHPHNPSGALAPLPAHDVLCPTCSRPVPSLLLDAAVQTLLYSVASHDVSTQQPLTEFPIGCIFSNDTLDREASPSAHCNAGSASPPQPADIATLCSPSSASHASDCYHSRHRVSRSMPGSAPYMVCLLKRPPVRPRLCTSISATPPATCQYHPSGNKSCALSFCLQEKCNYRPSGKPQSCWCSSSSRNWSFS